MPVRVLVLIDEFVVASVGLSPWFEGAKFHNMKWQDHGVKSYGATPQELIS